MHIENRQMMSLYMKLLKDEGIIAQYIMLNTLQQNSVAKKRNHMLMEMVESKINNSELSLFLWSEGLKTIMYILNKVGYLQDTF